MSIETSPARPIHIFNGFRTPYGGSEQEALTLHRQLREHQDVTLWTSSSRACLTLMKQEGIRLLPHFSDKYPMGYSLIPPMRRNTRHLLQWLIHDSNARQRLGEESRQTVEGLYGQAVRDHRLAFYLK